MLVGVAARRRLVSLSRPPVCKGRNQLLWFWNSKHRLLGIVATMFLWLCAGNVVHGAQWPKVLALSKEFVVDYSSGWVEIDLPFVGEDSLTKYLFWCRGGTTENLDAYEEKTGMAFAGSFLCRLNAGAMPEDLSLLQEDGAAVWFSRGQFSADAVEGKCATYPEFGAVRNFHLRNIRLTITLRKIAFRPDGGFRRLNMHVEVRHDLEATGDVARRPNYLPPKFGDCSKVKVGIQPRMCRAKNLSWIQCEKIGK